jgi:hypothetical protein
MWMAAAILLCSAAEPAASVCPDPAAVLTAERLSALERGEMVAVKSAKKDSGGNSSAQGLVIVLIHRPLAVTWGYLKDYEKFPEYMPRITKVEVYHKDGPTTGLKETLKVAWKTVVYHLLQTEEAGETECRLTWTLDPSRESDIASTDGCWILRAHGEDKTIALYTLHADSGMRVPQFLENYLMNRDLPGVAEALKQRVESDGTWKR